MGKMLLGLAAIAAMGIAAPAAAGYDEPFVGTPNANGAVGTFGGSAFAHPGFDGRSRRGGNGNGGVWISGGQWAQYNNPAFKSDSYNDWWHDRPDRAYPAWMRNNQQCEKLWYSGATLRC